MSINVKNIRNSLNELVDAVGELQHQPVPQPKILDRELSGNKINGGMITNFASVGIKDESTKQVLQVHDGGISVDNIYARKIINPLTVQGELTVKGQIKAEKLQVNEISADVRNERTSPLEFRAENGNLGGKGLIWSGADHTRQFVFMQGNDRLWSSEDIDIHGQKTYRVDNLPVLNLTTLGPSVVKSSIQQLGVVQNLETEGNVNLDQFIFWDSGAQRLGIGTSEPNGILSIKDIDHEFIIDPTNEKTFNIGTWTTTDLNIITDNIERITVSRSGQVRIVKDLAIDGKLGIGVRNFADDADITTSGPVRIQGKKREVGNGIPDNGNYVKGDIVWNDNPVPSGYVGWICTRSGTPGDWKAFGLIQD